MADPQHVKPFTGRQISARDWNAFVDATKKVNALAKDIQRFEKQIVQSGLLLVRNGSCENLDRFTILTPVQATIDPAKAELYFKQAPALDCDTPAAAMDDIVVLYEPTLSCGGARAVVSGVTVCKVNKTSIAHRFARATPGVTSYLTSNSSTNSPAKILWSEKGVGVKWAIIQLTNAHSSPAPVDDSEDPPLFGSAACTGTSKWVWDVADGTEPEWLLVESDCAEVEPTTPEPSTNPTEVEPETCCPNIWGEPEEHDEPTNPTEEDPEFTCVPQPPMWCGSEIGQCTITNCTSDLYEEGLQCGGGNTTDEPTNPTEVTNPTEFEDCDCDELVGEGCRSTDICIWVVVPNATLTGFRWVLKDDFNPCSNSCPCPEPEEPPSVLNECAEVETGCQHTPIPLPPTPSCVGRCSWYWPKNGTKWLYFGTPDSCLGNGPGTVKPPSCNCSEPLYDGSDCESAVTPCQMALEDAVNPQDDLTECEKFCLYDPPEDGTTTVEGCLQGHCEYQWNVGEADWDLIADHCEPCDCFPPVSPPDSDCEVRFTACRPPIVTTTTSTSTSTSTTSTSTSTSTSTTPEPGICCDFEGNCLLEHDNEEDCVAHPGFWVPGGDCGDCEGSTSEPEDCVYTCTEFFFGGNDHNYVLTSNACTGGECCADLADWASGCSVELLGQTTSRACLTVGQCETTSSEPTTTEESTSSSSSTEESTTEESTSSSSSTEESTTTMDGPILGACCDGMCYGIMTEAECAVEAGGWFPGEDCDFC